MLPCTQALVPPHAAWPVKLGQSTGSKGHDAKREGSGTARQGLGARTSPQTLGTFPFHVRTRIFLATPRPATYREELTILDAPVRSSPSGPRVPPASPWPDGIHQPARLVRPGRAPRSTRRINPRPSVDSVAATQEAVCRTLPTQRDTGGQLQRTIPLHRGAL